MDFKYRNIHCYPCHHSPKHFGNRRFEQKQRTAKALQHLALQHGRHWPYNRSYNNANVSHRRCSNAYPGFSSACVHVRFLGKQTLVKHNVHHIFVSPNCDCMGEVHGRKMLEGLQGKSNKTSPLKTRGHCLAVGNPHTGSNHCDYHRWCRSNSSRWMACTWKHSGYGLFVRHCIFLHHGVPRSTEAKAKPN